MKKKLLALTLLLSSAGVVQVATAKHMSYDNGSECNTCCPKKKCCKRSCCGLGCCRRSCCC